MGQCLWQRKMTTLSALLLFWAAAFAPLLLLGCAADKTGEPFTYNETLSAQYIWLNQITGMNDTQIETWTCGLACETVQDVYNAQISQHGFPLDTMAVTAQFGTDECIVAFRGSKTLLNYLLDDFNIVWTWPYESCPDCCVHEGFYKSWRSLSEGMFAQLHALGCDKRPIRVTGHSLGGAMAAIASFEMARNYTLKHIYTYGQPRIGNKAWVETFEQRVHNIPYFRVTDYMDAVPHTPPRGVVASSKDAVRGRAASPSGLPIYQHPGPEVYYSATRMGAYKICAEGEDPTCSGQFSLAECLLHTCCHCSYLGLNPCQASAKPQCVQPSNTSENAGASILV